MDCAEKNVEPLAVPAPEAAKMLGISLSHFYALNSSARLPRPVRFGKSVRWPVSVLNRWLEAGAPNREEWESWATSA